MIQSDRVLVKDMTGSLIIIILLSLDYYLLWGIGFGEERRTVPVLANAECMRLKD